MAELHRDLVPSGWQLWPPEGSHPPVSPSMLPFQPQCALDPRNAEIAHVWQQADEQATPVARWTCPPKPEACGTLYPWA